MATAYGHKETRPELSQDRVSYICVFHIVTSCNPSHQALSVKTGVGMGNGMQIKPLSSIAEISLTDFCKFLQISIDRGEMWGIVEGMNYETLLLTASLIALVVGYVKYRKLKKTEASKANSVNINIVDNLIS